MINTLTSSMLFEAMLATAHSGHSRLELMWICRDDPSPAFFWSSKIKAIPNVQS